MNLALDVRVALLAAAAMAGTGCASLSTVQTAHTLRPGESKVALNASLAGGGLPGVALETGAAPPFHAVGFPIPQGEIEYRYGLAPRWDTGFRLFLLGMAGDVKFQFLQGEKWDAAFAPGTSISYLYLPVESTTIQAGEVDVVLPLLFGRDLGMESSFVVGPKIQARTSFSEVRAPEVSGRGTRFILLAGGGAVLNLGFGNGWSIPLELSVYNDWTEKTGLAYSAGIGISVTSSRRPRWRARSEQEEE